MSFVFSPVFATLRVAWRRRRKRLIAIHEFMKIRVTPCTTATIPPYSAFLGYIMSRELRKEARCSRHQRNFRRKLTYAKLRTSLPQPRTSVSGLRTSLPQLRTSLSQLRTTVPGLRTSPPWIYDMPIPARLALRRHA